MKQKNRTLVSYIRAILIAWFCMAVSVAKAAPSDTEETVASIEETYAISSDSKRFYDNYPYIVVLPKGTQPYALTDEDILKMAAKVIFPVNIYVMPKDAPLLNELENDVIPQLNRDSLQLVRMLVRGAASPEGPTDFNRFLGEHRAAALFNFFRARLTIPVPESAFYTEFEVEDYTMVSLMMKEAGDTDYAYMKSLCDKYLPENRIAELKQQLQQAQGGQLWPRLLREYYPQVRAARIILFVRKVEPVLHEGEGTVSVTNDASVKPTLTVPSMTQWPEPSRPLLGLMPRRELLSIKTNLLFYGLYMPGYDRWCPIPNVAIEYYPKRGHFTFGASFDMPWWQDYDGHKYFQLRNYQVESRYYLKDSSRSYGTYGTNRTHETNGTYQAPAFSGFYVSAYAHGGLFGICFDADRGWVGEGAGAGIGAGYVMPISKNGHWRLEFAAQAGFFRCKYDPYQYENPVNPNYRDNLYYYKWTQKPELFKKRQYRFSWLGPTRIGVTLSYDLLYRRIQRKGASFKSTEETLSLPLPVMEGSRYITPKERNR